ncbi:vicilin-like seed storage protein At2g18540 [Portunus trituberculatus]|uniref:vicilin-like seed storage protein At2g18540 n=1 Tax=Portunus trituberculatus TaxID=210409 RepID=UPI001E1CB53D|nr:vicilin-like seed storage protein At2g18540 [Portunus trituberculatus]XP_045103957.1 vicilin-like seed storage protein At2g18540 [Portunus trituberculatus]
MATTITKWTREKGTRKDFVDHTRRSHQRLRVVLSSSDAARMREMAGRRQGEEAGRRLEDREDVMVRRRIERLRALLHDVTLEKEEKKQHSPGHCRVDSRSVEDLREEAVSRTRALGKVRKYLPPPAAPITPLERGEKIHAQVLKALPVQVKERQERRKQLQEEDAMWAQRVRQNQRLFEEDLERERREKEQKKNKVKKDLDQLCKERAGLRQEESNLILRGRQELEKSHQVYHRYQQHQDAQAAKEKERKREELLKEIEKVKAERLKEAVREEQLREEQLRYSAVKRAFARHVKQKTLDKMQGKRGHRIGREAPL